MTDNHKCTINYNPFCITLVFLFGGIVGMLVSDFVHLPLFRNIVVLLVATTTFHLTHHQPVWLSKFLKKGS